MNWGQTRILVTGGSGFIGSYLTRRLEALGVRHLKKPTSSDCDLRNLDDCQRAVEGVDVVVHLAARVGGIGLHARNPSLMFHDNLVMGTNIIEAARVAGVGRFLNVGTVCSYPAETPAPFCEDRLWDGYPDGSNAPFGVAKKSLLAMGQAYRAQYGFGATYVIPASVYGPEDHFEPGVSHVIPALIKRFYDAIALGAGRVVCWGDGQSTRDFVYITDVVDGLVGALECLNTAEPINLGSGREVSISHIVDTIAVLTNYPGEIVWDTSKPNGQRRRSLDSSRARAILDWAPEVELEEGLQRTVDWYRSNPRPVTSPEE